VEGLVNVISAECGRFEVRELVELCERLSLGCGDRPVFEIDFVADECCDSVRITELMDVRKPTVEVIERFANRQIENEDNANRTPEVCFGDGTESLLSGSVPDLELDRLAIDLNLGSEKFDTDCRLALGGENIIDQTLENCGFADAAVPNDDELEGSSVVERSHEITARKGV
jgi:hypothetical protein